ncbi:MAG: protein kinase [Anaerolineales bacterium]|nr:protein kinase [Anaerolineales bacterium]
MDLQKDQAKSSSLFDQLIDQYKLEAHINQTTVTDLYRALDVDEHRIVAVEVLLPTFNNKKQFVEQFIEKMNKVSQIKHPNIAQVYQIGVTPNKRPYIARDFVDGIPLRERLRQLSEQGTPANSIYALKIIRQLAEALELAERLDLYHYYLSPDNIQLKQDGNVVLVDLGVPALENGSAVKTDFATSQAYIAPEIQQGKAVDSRSQIYSLGVILHEILVGQVPPDSGSVWHAFSQAIRPQNTLLEEARPDLTRQTYELVEKCIIKQPWARYGSIKEFLDAIDEALQNERMLVQARGDTAVLTPPPPRRSRLALLLPVAGLTLIAIIAAVFLSMRASSNNLPTSEPVAVDTTITETQAPTQTIPPTTTAVSPIVEPTSDTAVAAYPVATLPLNSNPITLLAPGDAAEVEAGTTAVFRWNWSGTLQENEQFSVYLINENGRTLLGSLDETAVDGTYTLQTLIPININSPMSEWLIVLEDMNTNRDITASNSRTIAIKPTNTTATPTPTQTPTATFTPTSTPIPQATIFVSSASLRQGPDIVYPILRYLYEGTVVGVIGQDSRGDWYNVVLNDGSRGWVAATACRWANGSSGDNIPVAATIPPRPTNTPTPTPTNTPTPTLTPTPRPVTSVPPTRTPTATVPPLPQP